ncbi:MAG: LpxA family transferase, partial [Bacteroidia bacterium]|nr:LpxA family transferase [Bacteroidia bacterium]
MNNNNFDWPRYIKLFADCFPNRLSDSPWQITSGAADVIAEILSSLSLDYSIKDGVAIHRSAILENNITVKAPAIIGSNCFIAANCYLRGGVYLLSHNSIGPGCEIKSSLIFPHTNL